MKFSPKPRCCCPLAEPLHLNFEGNFSRLSEWLEKEPALKGSQIDLIPVFLQEDGAGRCEGALPAPVGVMRSPVHLLPKGHLKYRMAELLLFSFFFFSPEKLKALCETTSSVRRGDNWKCPGGADTSEGAARSGRNISETTHKLNKCWGENLIIALLSQQLFS